MGRGKGGGGDEALLCLILRHAMAREGTWALHAETAGALLELASASIPVRRRLIPCRVLALRLLHCWACSIGGSSNEHCPAMHPCFPAW